MEIELDLQLTMGLFSESIGKTTKTPRNWDENGKLN